MSDDRLLRKVLQGNAAVSAVWGLAAVLGAGFLDERLGVHTAAMIGVGIFALAAAGLCWRFASREVLRPSEGWVATVGDALFGLGLLAVGLLAPDVTTLGRWVISLSGMLTLGLADVEWLAVRQLVSTRSVTERRVSDAGARGTSA